MALDQLLLCQYENTGKKDPDPQTGKIKDRNKEATARNTPGESREEGAELLMAEPLGMNTEG